MTTPNWNIPGLVDQLREYSSEQDRVEFERTFTDPDASVRMMAATLIAADPSTPANYLRKTYTAQPVIPVPPMTYGDAGGIDQAFGTPGQDVSSVQGGVS